MSNSLLLMHIAYTPEVANGHKKRLEEAGYKKISIYKKRKRGITSYEVYINSRADYALKERTKQEKVRKPTDSEIRELLDEEKKEKALEN